MDPNSADKLHLLLQLGRYAEAERAAREVLAGDPESSSGYYYLAQALLCLDRYPEAFDASDRVLALVLNRWYAHTQRSALLQITGRMAEAVEAAETAMRLDHTEPGVHLRLASALSGAGREAESTEVISGARRQFPADPDILYYAGLLALDRKDMAAVVEVAKRGAALDPTKPGFHMLAGVATGHQAQNDLPEGPERQYRHRVAERRLAEAVRMDPTNAEFRRLRKDNARGSRDEVMVKVLAGWMFGMAAGAFFLPVFLGLSTFPCWFFLVLPLAVGFLGGLCSALVPEFSLVLPLRWFNVVTVPLLPEERRKGWAAWFVFLAVTVAALVLPMLLMPTAPHAPAAHPTRRDSGFRLPSPTKGKAPER
jgi:tetratricopeptide (TPR) repeat protein